MNLSRREKVGLAFGLAGILFVLLLAAYIPSGPRKAYLDSVSDLKGLKAELQLTPGIPPR